MSQKSFYWIPRILSVISILFMLIFSFDVFNGNDSTGRKLLGFLVNNIPVLILTVVLIIAWKWEVAGGILFILAFIAASIFFRSFSGNPWSLVVTIPFLVTGGLFILYYFLYGSDAEARKKQNMS